MRAEVDTGKVLQLARSDEGLATNDFTLDPEILRRHHIGGFMPASEVAQPFFAVRSHLLKHALATQQRIFAVTSVQPGDGKTHVALNLAAVLSRVRPTILIELDLRRPSIGERLGLPADHIGIDDYLSGACGLSASAIHANGHNLTIHRVRCPHSTPENLLGSTRLMEMSAAIRAMDDGPICIVDTPPAVINDDMMMIMPAVQGILMVVQEGRTSKHALSAIVRSLSPTPIIGTLLNKSISSSRTIRGYENYYTSNAG